MSVSIKAEAFDGTLNWEEAVQDAAGMLVELGVAEPRYVQACIDSLHRNGPYIVLTKGVALAHARPEDGATAVGVSLLHLGVPVEFGHPSNDPVDLVFAFCTDAPNGHIALLKRLAKELSGGLAERLRKASPAELQGILQEAVSDE